MTKRRWKNRQPTSMQEAIRLCLDYAQHRHNAGVQRIGDLIQCSEWTIYKWMADGSLPSRRIPPFELACGANYVTQYLAHTAQKFLIDIPSGRTASQNDLLSLQSVLNEAVNQLTAFYSDSGASEDTITAVGNAMKSLAGHRENVVRYEAPELALFGEGE